VRNHVAASLAKFGMNVVFATVLPDNLISDASVDSLRESFSADCYGWSACLRNGNSFLM
jgi:hypothetical protein